MNDDLPSTLPLNGDRPDRRRPRHQIFLPLTSNLLAPALLLAAMREHPIQNQLSFFEILTYAVVLQPARGFAVAFKRRSVVPMSCGRLREAGMVPRMNLQLQKLVPGRPIPCGTSPEEASEWPHGLSRRPECDRFLGRLRLTADEQISNRSYSGRRWQLFLPFCTDPRQVELRGTRCSSGLK